MVDASLVEAPTSTKKPLEGVRSGDASDEEGEPVALRDEDARGRGRGDRGGAQPGSDGGERVGRGARAPSAAREGEAAWGDAGYQGMEKRRENRGGGVEWQVAMRPGRRRQLDADGEEARREKEKASIRAKAEHPFFYVKRMFGYDKVRYRGLHKNKQRIALLLGFANLLIAERSLAA